VIETPEWQEKITAAEALLASEDAEAIAMMQRYEGRELAFCRRALAVTRVLLQETRTSVPDRGWPVIVNALFVHMTSILRASLRLAVGGHGRELPIMIRPALEALITLFFIAQRDEEHRANVWVEHTAIAKQKLARKHEDLFVGNEHQAKRKEIDERAAAVADSFPKDRKFWAAGLGCSDLRVMADQVGLLWYYDSIYWTGSQPIHATAIAVEEIISLPTQDGGPVYKLGLSGVDVDQYLAAYCDFLIRGLSRLNDLFMLRIEAALAGLTAEYQSLFATVLEREPPR
jgi:hypothetical protein